MLLYVGDGRSGTVADGSSIEWTQATWNPTTGCDKVSAGCDNCYALTLAKRLKAMGAETYQHDGDPRTSGPGFGISIHPEALRLSYTWRTPQLVFVDSMRDLSVGVSRASVRRGGASSVVRLTALGVGGARQMSCTLLGASSWFADPEPVRRASDHPADPCRCRIRELRGDRLDLQGAQVQRLAVGKMRP
jgi:phage protein Gp37/Gp68